MTQNHESHTPDRLPRPPFEQHRCGYLNPDETVLMFRALEAIRPTIPGYPESDLAFGFAMLGGNFAQELAQQVKEHPHYADTLIGDLVQSDHEADRILAGTILYARQLAQVYSGTLGDPKHEAGRWVALIQGEQLDQVRQRHLQECDILAEHLEVYFIDDHPNLRPFVANLNALLESSGARSSAEGPEQQG